MSAPDIHYPSSFPILISHRYMSRRDAHQLTVRPSRGRRREKTTKCLQNFSFLGHFKHTDIHISALFIRYIKYKLKSRNFFCKFLCFILFPFYFQTAWQLCCLQHTDEVKGLRYLTTLLSGT